MVAPSWLPRPRGQGRRRGRARAVCPPLLCKKLPPRRPPWERIAEYPNSQLAWNDPAARRNTAYRLTNHVSAPALRSWLREVQERRTRQRAVVVFLCCLDVLVRTRWGAAAFGAKLPRDIATRVYGFVVPRGLAVRWHGVVEAPPVVLDIPDELFAGDDDAW